MQNHGGRFGHFERHLNLEVAFVSSTNSPRGVSHKNPAGSWWKTPAKRSWCIMFEASTAISHDGKCSSQCLGSSGKWHRAPNFVPPMFFFWKIPENHLSKYICIKFDSPQWWSHLWSLPVHSTARWNIYLAYLGWSKNWPNKPENNAVTEPPADCGGFNARIIGRFFHLMFWIGLHMLPIILLMEEILHHLECLKPSQWFFWPYQLVQDVSINSIRENSLDSPQRLAVTKILTVWGSPI